MEAGSGRIKYRVAVKYATRSVCYAKSKGEMVGWRSARGVPHPMAIKGTEVGLQMDLVLVIKGKDKP